MELEDLKSAWENTSDVKKPTSAIAEMLKERKHPVLRELRLQLLIEITGWIAFILLANSMFDASKKPVAVNVFTLVCITLPILHHVFGYQLSKRPIAGPNISISLQHYILAIKNYAIVSVTIRALLLIGILAFFTYGLELNSAKIYSILAISSIFILQLFALAVLWKKRISSLKDTLIALNEI